MGEELDFVTFTRRPFVVEAVQITEDNMEELADLIGDIRTKDDVRYIALDRRIVPNIRKAFVDWWVTRMDDNLRCYSPKIFEEQFEEAVEAQLFTSITTVRDIPTGDFRDEGVLVLDEEDD